ncbi:hypothetical protein GCM10023334_066690 [Nonomuraea thailandensis]
MLSPALDMHPECSPTACIRTDSDERVTCLRLHPRHIPRRSHPPTASFSPRSPDVFADYLSETASPQVEISPGGGSWLSGERSPNGHSREIGEQSSSNDR